MCSTLIVPFVYLVVCYFSEDLKVEFIPLIISFIVGAGIDVLHTIFKG